MDNDEKKKVRHSLIFPSILLLILWAVKLAEIWFKTDFSNLGIYPQHFDGLKGILFAPVLHGSLGHLSANSVPLFVLTAGLFYFYERKAVWIFVFSWLITGFWVWAFAKDTGIHIGASGVVYALASFHFVSGLLRREPRIMAFSLLVVFLYGGLIWGMIPNFLPEKNISWESHLLGMLAGLILAYFYRGSGPQRKQYVWDDEDDDNDPVDYSAITDEPGNETPRDTMAEKPSPAPSVKIIYHLKKDENDPEKSRNPE